MCSNGPESSSFLSPLLRPWLDFHRRAECRAPWCGHVAVGLEGNRLVGICGFKGIPAAVGGAVEISDGTVPRFPGNPASEAARLGSRFPNGHEQG